MTDPDDRQQAQQPDQQYPAGHPQQGYGPPPGTSPQQGAYQQAYGGPPSQGHPPQQGYQQGPPPGYQQGPPPHGYPQQGYPQPGYPPPGPANAPGPGQMRVAAARASLMRYLMRDTFALGAGIVILLASVVALVSMRFQWVSMDRRFLDGTESGFSLTGSLSLDNASMGAMTPGDAAEFVSQENALGMVVQPIAAAAGLSAAILVICAVLMLTSARKLAGAVGIAATVPMLLTAVGFAVLPSLVDGTSGLPVGPETGGSPGGQTSAGIGVWVFLAATIVALVAALAMVIRDSGSGRGSGRAPATVAAAAPRSYPGESEPEGGISTGPHSTGTSSADDNPSGEHADGPPSGR